MNRDGATLTDTPPCPRCGYGLSGHTGMNDRCPQCGLPGVFSAPALGHDVLPVAMWPGGYGRRLVQTVVGLWRLRPVWIASMRRTTQDGPARRFMGVTALLLAALAGASACLFCPAVIVSTPGRPVPEDGVVIWRTGELSGLYVAPWRAAIVGSLTAAAALAILLTFCMAIVPGLAAANRQQESTARVLAGYAQHVWWPALAAAALLVAVLGGHHVYWATVFRCEDVGFRVYAEPGWLRGVLVGVSLVALLAGAGQLVRFTRRVRPHRPTGLSVAWVVMWAALAAAWLGGVRLGAALW